MKNIITILLIMIGLGVTGQVNAQEVQVIQLEQTEGEFDKKKLKLKAGELYQFEVLNNGVDHEVGFVIAPAGSTEQKDHIQEAYLSKTIGDGMTASSGKVSLEAGEYVYFCPLNPTPQYKILVK